MQSSIISSHLFTVIVYFQKQLKLLSMPSTPTSILTLMDLSESDLATPISSPVPSLSESESRLSYSDKLSVHQPRIDSAFKQIKSFEDNIYIYI